ncbi:hypothetical protein SAMN04488029_0264 [Reichenbachiella faecimaris]|uniref:LTXXQ motif family protein n=1 Tax=Reichenbachiella faecimaris TaxID=692418 RepID=A0A1W2G6J9_REIFA|nr:hypothetical protein [Reichenbachiella faecimaris]SMD31926.1 hypothetical protein SAMN04488029_0264 [Reichenbachiella faecimaris]
MNIFVLMKKLFLAIMLLAIATIAQAQNDEARQRIESAKIALISERLGLTPEDAQQFWPIYNEYSQKRRENHHEFAQARRNFNPETATEQETQDMLNFGREVKEKQLNLEKEYSDRMLKVIDSKQLMNLQNAERDFKRMLLDRLDQRRQQQQNSSEQLRRQNNERMRNKRNN